jgi:arginine-tRNA-protein transferase
MHTRVIKPTTLTGPELDRYLARGWYRIGQTMMTCRFVVFSDVLRSAVWTRLDLDAHRFRKSQRRVMRRIDEQLRVEIVDPSLDAAHEAVYQRYRTVARGERSASLSDFLYGDRPADLDVFDTREIRFIREDGTPEGQLVGFSWFDLGDSALQSLVGVYDPDFAHLSLGYASMLYEMRWGIERGYRWFYPGYVLPGDPAMDYKLRAGAMEFLGRDGVWHPWEAFDPELQATRLLEQRLADVRRHLEDRDVPHAQELYPMFEAPAWHTNLANCLPEPVILTIPLAAPRNVLCVSWDMEREAYRLRRCLRASAISRSVNDELDSGTPVELFVVMAEVATREEPAAIAAVAAEDKGRKPIMV